MSDNPQKIDDDSAQNKLLEEERTSFFQKYTPGTPIQFNAGIDRYCAANGLPDLSIQFARVCTVNDETISLQLEYTNTDPSEVVLPVSDCITYELLSYRIRNNRNLNFSEWRWEH